MRIASLVMMTVVDVARAAIPAPPPRRNTTYAFRIRALSDAGMNEPSSPATTYVGRRRAVR